MQRSRWRWFEHNERRNRDDVGSTGKEVQRKNQEVHGCRREGPEVLLERRMQGRWLDGSGEEPTDKGEVCVYLYVCVKLANSTAEVNV